MYFVFLFFLVIYTFIKVSLSLRQIMKKDLSQKHRFCKHLLHEQHVSQQSCNVKTSGKIGDLVTNQVLL